MSQPAIEVQGLSKRYRIGTRGMAERRTLGRALLDLVAAPVRNLGKLRRLTEFDTEDAPDVLWSLKEVSFDVQQGEAVGVIGRNGAGKSTLLKILSRITEPTRGRAVLRGRVGSLLEIGTGFHPELTGRENVHLSGAMLGMTRRETNAKLDEIVSFSEVERFIDTPVKRYSSGMYVRLAFAVAAHLEPEILIVDEVLAVGDAAFQRKCMGRMGTAAKQGRTILFVSHNMSAINSLCQRALWIDGGRIRADGDAMDVVKRYLSVGSSASGHKAWPDGDGPTNGEVRLNSVTLLDTTGQPAAEVTLSTDTLVTIEFDVLRAGAKPAFSLVLLDDKDMCVFSALSNVEGNLKHGQPLPVGTHRASCRMYGNLLNDGAYSITIIGFDAFYKNAFRADQVLSFRAIDDGVLKRDYLGTYGGVVRPKLEWSMEAA